MDVRKNHTTSSESSQKASENTTEKLATFVGDVKGEINKISWTSPEELKTYTKIVVATTFFMGMGIYVIDLVIQGFLNSLGMIIRLISG